MKSRVVGVLLAAAVLAGCSSSTEPKGDSTLAASGSAPVNQSRADKVLTRDAVRMLKTLENAMRLVGDDSISAFGMPSVVAKKITQEPDARGVWIEEWTVKRIGGRVVYAIKFIPSPDGGTDISISTPPRKL